MFLLLFELPTLVLNFFVRDSLERRSWYQYSRSLVMTTHKVSQRIAVLLAADYIDLLGLVGHEYDWGI